jgi:hypothetical protein
MPDYSNGKIYAIRCRNDNTKIYVGSTIQPLAVRFGGHKKESKTEKNTNKLLFIEVNNDWSNWYIELYENFPCSCREELCKREGEIIRLIGTLNMLVAGRDKKERRIEYREENKEKIKEMQKQYDIKRKDNRKEYYIENKDKFKEYYIENKDRIKERKRLYYLKKKEEKLKVSD